MRETIENFLGLSRTDRSLSGRLWYFLCITINPAVILWEFWDFIDGNE